MNILFLSDTTMLPNSGGIERVSFLLAEEFIKHSHSVFFVSTQHPSNSQHIPASNVIPTVNIPSNNSSFKTALSQYLINNKIDVVINQTFTFAIIPYLKIIKDLSIPVISTLHNRPYPTYGFEKQYLKLYSPSTFKAKFLKGLGLGWPFAFGQITKRSIQSLYMSIGTYSDKFLLLSNTYKDRLISLTPKLSISKIDAINNPNTFSQKSNVDKQKENILLFVGRLANPQKNVTDFIDCWNLFHKNHPDWKGAIVGDGPDRNKFEQYAINTNASDLTFYGNQRDVSIFYEKAKLLCMTSIYEGWPMVLAEAMAYGCVPCAYNTFEAVNELISDNHNGCVTPPFNTKLMAQKLSHIAQDDNLLKTMAQNARNSISCFKAEDIALRWIDLITSITDSN